MYYIKYNFKYYIQVHTLTINVRPIKKVWNLIFLRGKYLNFDVLPLNCPERSKNMKSPFFKKKLDLV